jgi:hypothetical protein
LGFCLHYEDKISLTFSGFLIILIFMPTNQSLFLKINGRESVRITPNPGRRLITVSIAAAAAFLITSGSAFASKIQPLTESTLVEVINDVSILQGEELDAIPAEQSMVLRAPDFLETGRRSRARMEAEDGTITRVGSNTLFAFDQVSRTVKLNRGSLLFHSPDGRGGGRIVTASATASVLGTTIMTVATPDGGFKILVLEGTARVDFLNGTSRILGPGQMTFVLPGGGVNSANQGETGGEGSGANSGEPGPVLNFDLSRLSKGSNLLNGFGEELPSQPKILEAIEAQLAKIKEGEFDATDALILTADLDEVVLLEGKSLIENMQNIRARSEEEDQDPDPEDPVDPILTEQQRLLAALETDADISKDGFASDLFFPLPGVMPPPDAVEGELFPEDFSAFGFVARSILFSGGTHDISPIAFDPSGQNFDLFFYDGLGDLPDGVERDLAVMLALGPIRFSGGNLLSGFETDTDVLMASPSEISFADSASLHVQEDLSSPTPAAKTLGVGAKNELIGIEPGSSARLVNLILSSDGGIDTGVGSKIVNPFGSIELESGGPIQLAGSISAGWFDDWGENSLRSSDPDYIYPLFGNIAVLSEDDIALNGAVLDGTGLIEISTTGAIRIYAGDGIQTSEGFFGSSIYGSDVHIEADNGVEIFDSYIGTGADWNDDGYYDQHVRIESDLSHVILDNARVESGHIHIEGGSGVTLSSTTLDSTGDYFYEGYGEPGGWEGFYTNDLIDDLDFIDNGDLIGNDLIIASASGDVMIENGSDLYGESVYIESVSGDLTVDNSSLGADYGDVRLFAGNTVRVDTSEISAGFIEVRGDEVYMVGQNTSDLIFASDLNVVADSLAEFVSMDLSGLSQINIEGQTLYFEDFTFPGHGNVWLTSQNGGLNIVSSEGGSPNFGMVNFKQDAVWISIDGTPHPAPDYVTGKEVVLIHINAPSAE